MVPFNNKKSHTFSVLDSKDKLSKEKSPQNQNQKLPEIEKSKEEHTSFNKRLDKICEESDGTNREKPEDVKREENYYLVDTYTTQTKNNLPNQVNQQIESVQDIEEKILKGETPIFLKRIHKSSLHVEVPQNRNKLESMEDQKHFPLSATLPRKFSANLLDQLRKQSAHDLNLHKSSSNSVSCLVCFDKQPNAVFMNCGHGGLRLF